MGEALVGALAEAGIGERIEHGDAQPPAALDFDLGDIAGERIRESARCPRAAAWPGRARPDENRACPGREATPGDHSHSPLLRQ
jgi:hypothetical protein